MPADPDTPEAVAGVLCIQGQPKSDPSPTEVGEVGEIAYLVKCLHENPSSISRTHISCTCNPSAKKAETDGSLGFADQPA